MTNHEINQAEWTEYIPIITGISLFLKSILYKKNISDRPVFRTDLQILTTFRLGWVVSLRMVGGWISLFMNIVHICKSVLEYWMIPKTLVAHIKL